ncbi:MAG TPA: sigma-70 family RNA polymerase sigma factor [Mycobacteriales bacterium]|nr:sigma-70 family RNA polymerase sigma factor [Mycobacteriales bacterium]
MSDVAMTATGTTVPVAASRAVDSSARAVGGPRAFEEVYPQLFLPAMRLAFRITGDRTLAEDVAAEALARTYASWRKVRALPHLDAWVMRVATNVAIDAVRRRKPAEAARAELASAYERGLVGATRFDDAVVTRLALVAALVRLPKRQRDAIVLYYLAGLSDAEVSEALGIAASSVRTHLQRGLAALRRGLGDNVAEVLDDRA